MMLSELKSYVQGTHVMKSLVYAQHEHVNRSIVAPLSLSLSCVILPYTSLIRNLSDCNQ